ncbi:helix-hairpin-helix domain-containing protein [Micromonospora avicenniae]
MALTDGPAPVVAPRSAPDAERLDAAGAGESLEPAADTPGSEPATGSVVADEPVPATTPQTETGLSASFAAEPFGVLVPATDSEEGTRAHVEPVPGMSADVDAAPGASTGVAPAADTWAEATPAEATPAEATPVEATPVEAAAADRPTTNTPGAGARPAAEEAEDDARAEAPAAATRRSTVASPPVRPVAATSVEVDDFRRIQGIGPKMAAALQAAGVRTYQQLADLDETALRDLIRGAGLRAAPGLATWPQQARVLASAPDEAATALPAHTGTNEA